MIVDAVPLMLTAVLIFGLRVSSAALATVRTLLMSRGDEPWAATLGFFEVLVYVLSLGYVVANLSNAPVVVAYCLGFSAGTVVGMRIERRMALGFVTVRIVSRSDVGLLAEGLRGAGFGATVTRGEGRDGVVGIVESVVPRRAGGEAHRIARRIDPLAFVVVEDSRAVSAGWLGGVTPRSLGEQK